MLPNKEIGQNYQRSSVNVSSFKRIDISQPQCEKCFQKKRLSFIKNVINLKI